jgi:anti-anti-sigma regulatory factor
MLKISIVEEKKQRRLVVEGGLVAPWSDELKAACDGAGSGLNGRELVIDLKNLTTISQQGEYLLLELMQQGIRFRGCGVFTNEILKQVARRLRGKGAQK